MQRDAARTALSADWRSVPAPRAGRPPKPLRPPCPSLGVRLTIGHSPDADDAFMVYALKKGFVETNLEIELSEDPIDRLNAQAQRKALDVTALSAYAYGALSEAYRLLPVGTSVGRDYGPVVVAAEDVDPVDLAGVRVGVPGQWTTAYLTASLALPEFTPVEVPFDEMPAALAEGAIDAGVLIHEAQITYEAQGLVGVLDLGRWWREETDLPLPLGVNAVRRGLPASVQSAAARAFGESVQYALDHRSDALDFAMIYGSGLSREDVDRFVKMYVNEDTVQLRDDVVEALKELYERAQADGLLEDAAEVDPVAAP